MYTHLGNIKPKSERPDPYYPQPVFETLQDRHFNVSGTVPPERRICMTRGTALYDYAAMIRAVAPNVRRDGDVMLPFAALDEIEAHENLVPEGEAMTLTVNDNDRLVIPLDDYRAAYDAIQSCLTSL